MIDKARKGLAVLTIASLSCLTACASAPDAPAPQPVAFAAPVAMPAAVPAHTTPAPAQPKLVSIPEPDQNALQVVKLSKKVSCVPFARARSGIMLSGNAATWWSAAKGKYVRGHHPSPGAVMVFASTKRLHRGHLAVVRSVISSREIRVDHSNWMNNGRLHLNATILDVSENNDWSQVRVWNNLGGGQIGSRTYKISGFIAPITIAKAGEAAIN